MARRCCIICTMLLAFGLLAVVAIESFAAAKLSEADMSLIRGGDRCHVKVCGVVSVPCDVDPLDPNHCTVGEPNENCLNTEVKAKSVKDCNLWGTGATCRQGPTTACGSYATCNCNDDGGCDRIEPGEYSYNPCFMAN